MLLCYYTDNTTIELNYNPDTGKFISGSNEYDAIDIGNSLLTINSFNGGV